MKKTFRLLFLVGALALTVWTLNAKPVYALGSCDNINGGPCSPEGRTLRCTWSDGAPGLCVCMDALWSC
jgi:hypothetical protein